MTDTPKARTSETHPLLISEIALPEGHEGMALAITFLPGKKEFSPRGDWDRDVEADLAVIRDWKPTDIILIPAKAEQAKLGTPELGDHFRRASIYADIHQAAASQWPCPKDSYSRDIDDLPVIMRTPGRRLLIIGRYGQERSTVLAVEILMRDGVYRELRQAKAAVEDARPESLATTAQLDYLDYYWKRRRLKGGPTYTSCPLDKAKSRAARLRKLLAAEGTDLSHSEALERLAHIEGLKNWSTLRARLMKSQASSETHSEIGMMATARTSLLHIFELSYVLNCTEEIGKLAGGNEPTNSPWPFLGTGGLQGRYEARELSEGVQNRGFSHQRAKSISWGLVEGVRSFFGEDEPHFFERIADATKLGVGIPPHLVPEGGFKGISEVPEDVLLEISKAPGFLELLVLHEAGYGTEYGRKRLRDASLIAFGYDLEKAINGVPHITPAGTEHFGFGVLHLKRALKGLVPSLVFS